jgi:hypothetical protein
MTNSGAVTSELIRVPNDGAKRFVLLVDGRNAGGLFWTPSASLRIPLPATNAAAFASTEEPVDLAALEVKVDAYERVGFGRLDHERLGTIYFEAASTHPLWLKKPDGSVRWDASDGVLCGERGTVADHVVSGVRHLAFKVRVNPEELTRVAREFWIFGK